MSEDTESYLALLLDINERFLIYIGKMALKEDLTKHEEDARERAEKIVSLIADFRNEMALHRQDMTSVKDNVTKLRDSDGKYKWGTAIVTLLNALIMGSMALAAYLGASNKAPVNDPPPAPRHERR